MNRTVILASAFILMTSCSKTVDSMQDEEYVAVNASVDETETSAAVVVTEPPTESPTEPPTEPLEMPHGYELAESCRLDVETILQNPELPTGCEVTALATVLNYCGFEIGKVELCDNFLPIDPYAEYTFNEAYVGNPKSPDGFGCYAPVIAETADKYFESVNADWKALNISETDFQELFYQIEKGRPVIIWASMGLMDVQMKLQWTTADGDEAWFAELEHCMVLTGYDMSAGVVYAADPLKGDMEYSLERFESVYGQMGKQAVIIYEQENKA